MATTSSRAAASRQASMRHFSRKGLPTCTAERSSFVSSKEREASPDAPWMPSRPVSAPTSMIELPGPFAVEETRSPWLRRPTHMAFTSGFSP